MCVAWNAFWLCWFGDSCAWYSTGFGSLGGGMRELNRSTLAYEKKELIKKKNTASFKAGILDLPWKIILGWRGNCMAGRRRDSWCRRIYLLWVWLRLQMRRGNLRIISTTDVVLSNNVLVLRSSVLCRGLVVLACAHVVWIIWVGGVVRGHDDSRELNWQWNDRKEWKEYN